MISQVDALPTDVLDAARAALAAEPRTDREVFLARLRRWWPDLVDALTSVYGDAAPAVARRAVDAAVDGFRSRDPELRLQDLRRLVDPDWFQAPSTLGYAAYADRFAGTLAGVAAKVPYLVELGVTYLHLMPLLQPRPLPDDGGYAVMDYRRVRPDLGTMADVADLAAVLRSEGISLTLDLVLNHVAREHEWAVRARAGEERYLRYFHVYPDREVPDAYERNLPEVFPDFAPGSFTWDDDLRAWVWTTFNSWQWDLDWANPDVFDEFAQLVCFLANQGVECLRLDAIAFLWKRMGTTCQNQPEVHGLTQALRAVARIAAPALVLKAEAIVGPGDLVSYLGRGPRSGKVSDLAYHNSFMVQLWAAFAAQDARLAVAALRRFPPKPPTTAWAAYVRCHDDIGWAVDDVDAAAVGWNGHAHRVFLSDWYAGEFPGSDSRGLVFQENPQTGDRRISGTAASLLGLEAALDGGDAQAVDRAIRRILLAHAAILGFGGMPLLYMGDEIALRNDATWADDPTHSDDNRWVHRPAMPWDVVERRRTRGSLESRVWHGLRHLVSVRASLPSLHAAVESELLDLPATAVLGWVRHHPAQTLVALHNFSDHQQYLPRAALPALGGVDALTGGPPTGDEHGVWIEPWSVCWVVADENVA